MRQQLSQAVPDQMARLWIETRRRLVENQELRIVDERARKRQATLHAARQCANLCARATRESGELEQSRYAHVERRAVDLEIPAVDAQIFGDGEIGIEIVDLRDHTDAYACLACRLGHGPANHLDRAAVRIDQPEAAAQRRRLAGAVGSQQAEAFAAPNVERQATHDLVFAVAFAQIVDAQNDIAISGTHLVAPKGRPEARITRPRGAAQRR